MQIVSNKAMDTGKDADGTNIGRAPKGDETMLESGGGNPAVKGTKRTKLDRKKKSKVSREMENQINTI